MTSNKREKKVNELTTETLICRVHNAECIWTRERQKVLTAMFYTYAVKTFCLSLVHMNAVL